MFCLQVDLRLAAEVEELDVVVGGHSHSFLFTGTPAPEMVEEVEGDYPTYVTQPSTGRVVPVVQVNLRLLSSAHHDRMYSGVQVLQVSRRPGAQL